MTDPDVYGVASTLKLTLSVDNGILTLPDTSGLSIISGSNGSSAMVLLGTPENLSLSMEGMTLTPTTDFVGTVTLTLAADDQGNSGTGGSLTDNGEVQIYHAPTNDAPVLTASATQTLNEDGTLTLSSSVLQISDDADVDAVLKIEAIATNGTLKLSAADSSGVTVTQDGSVGTLAFSGTIEQINNAFSSLTFTPDLDYAGDASISFSADDQGAGGTGGSMIGSATLPITVTPVNDAPTISLPQGQIVAYDSTLDFSSANGNNLSLADIDAEADDLVLVSLEAQAGTLSLPQNISEDITLTSGDGVEDVLFEFEATLTAANTVLNGLSYTPGEPAEANTQIQITIDDQGNTGAGGSQSVLETLLISIDQKLLKSHRANQLRLL